MGEEKFQLSDIVSNYPFFLHYQGNYKDNLTVKIVDIVEANLSIYFKKAVINKLAYLVIEAVQNMERYSSSDEISGDFCYIFSDHQYFHVITQNKIKNAAISGLKERLDLVNSKNQEELRQIYTDVLASGERTSKGAGLGLIDMARKSGNHLAYEFTEISPEISTYRLHIKIPVLKDEHTFEDSAQTTSDLLQSFNQLFAQNKNTLFYSGDFSNNFLQTLLSMVSNLKTTDQIPVTSVFKYAIIELTQNMRRHAQVIDGKTPGFLCLEWRKEKVHMSTFNFIAEGPANALAVKLDKLNSSSLERLLEESEENLTDFSLKGGLGLIDISRLNWPQSINYKLVNHATFGTSIHLNTEFNYE
ncbi:MAG: SiaB family protein kinase [Flavobacteriales bacterium]